MELRTTEECLSELVGMYESLRQSPLWRTTTTLSSSSSSPLPPLPTHLQRLDTGRLVVPPAGTTTTNTDDVINIHTPVEDLSTAVQTIERMQSILKGTPPPQQPPGSTTTTITTATNKPLFSLPTSVDKFRKRLHEIDPITLQPRYGIQTMGRVQWVLETYDFLKHHMIVGDATTTTSTSKTTPTGDGEEAPTTSSSNSSTTTSLLQQLQDRYQQQVQREQEEQIRQEQERIRHEDEARLEQWRRQQEEQAMLQAERDREHQRQEEQRAQLRTQAELARQRRLAQERAEQEWFDGIPKGVEGVRQQLGILQESTKDHEEDPPRAYKTAIQSLYTLFQQINAHPEETKFRRIRREHEQFQADIGRYKGGVELLIAAGFTLGAIDDVPCYISKEPDIEKDMDGWSAWFDVLKGTLQLLEDEMIKKSH